MCGPEKKDGHLLHVTIIFYNFVRNINKKIVALISFTAGVAVA